MSEQTFFEAAILGVIEGLTEFLPVSSTGHLILLADLMGFSGPPGRVFEVVIQLGAILAICVVYAPKLARVAFGLPVDHGARRFALAVLLAFLPAVVLGVLLHGFIKTVLFSPYVVCAALILGGLAILAVERARPVPRISAIERFSPGLSVGIGLIQCLAMVPGVSRSGDDSRRAAARGRAENGGGVLVLPRHPDAARRSHLRPLEEPRRPDDRRWTHCGDRLSDRVRDGASGCSVVRRLRRAARVLAVRVVSDRSRWRPADRAPAPLRPKAARHRLSLHHPSDDPVGGSAVLILHAAWTIRPDRSRARSAAVAASEPPCFEGERTR